MGLLYSKIINIFYIKKTNKDEQLKIDVSHNATIRKRNHFMIICHHMIIILIEGYYKTIT